MSPSTSEISRQSIQEVKRRLNQGEPVYFVDVRRHPDENQIKAAVHYDPEAILTAERTELPVPQDRLIITYCT
jgi:hypothetical protein